MALYLYNYTINTDIDNVDDFLAHVETCQQSDILAKVTMEHENNVGQLAPGTDIKIEIIHPQEDTFKATPSGPVCFDISCDLFIEYSIASAQ